MTRFEQVKTLVKIMRTIARDLPGALAEAQKREAEAISLAAQLAIARAAVQKRREDWDEAEKGLVDHMASSGQIILAMGNLAQAVKDAGEDEVPEEVWVQFQRSEAVLYEHVVSANE